MSLGIKSAPSARRALGGLLLGSLVRVQSGPFERRRCSDSGRVETAGA
jgi:hypothetical protein